MSTNTPPFLKNDREVRGEIKEVEGISHQQSIYPFGVVTGTFSQLVKLPTRNISLPVSAPFENVMH